MRILDFDYWNIVIMGLSLGEVRPRVEASIETCLRCLDACFSTPCKP